MNAVLVHQVVPGGGDGAGKATGGLQAQTHRGTSTLAHLPGAKPAQGVVPVRKACTRVARSCEKDTGDPRRLVSASGGLDWNQKVSSSRVGKDRSRAPITRDNRHKKSHAVTEPKSV